MRVDEAVCQGHGLCQREAPEVFQLPDDLEYAIVLLEVISPELEGAAQRALVGCPEQAIEEVSGVHN